MRNNKMNNSGRRFSSRLFLSGVIGIVLSISALNSNASAQLSGRPDRGFQAGNSYAISDIEAINMNSGNVSMSIPLASLPKGRGTSPGFTISLTYNSKIWDSGQKWESDGTQPTSSNPISYDYTRNLLKPAEDGGWQVFIDYKMKVIYRNLIADENGLETEEFERCVPNNTNYSKNGYAYKLEMQMPGGGVTVFRPYGSGADFVDYHKDGFYKIDINGLAHHYSLTTHINDPDLGGRATCQYTTYQITTSGMNYYSTDGSNIRLFVPYVSGAYSTSGDRRWTMYYPNGTVIENKPTDDLSIRQRITDVNNNRVKIKNDSHNGVAGTKILDDAGRFIFYGGGKAIQSSVNGQELETTLTWKDVWVHREYQTITVNDSITPIPANKRKTFVSKQFSMINEIILPMQAGGLTYKFMYHGDDANPQTGTQPYNETDGWGELASVKLPSGAKVEYKYLVPEFAGPTSFLEIISNSIVQKNLIYDDTYDNQTTPRRDTWLYEISTGVGRITSPDGGVTTQLFYAKSPYSKDTSPDPRAGLVYEVTNPDGTVIDRTWKQAGTQTTGSGQALNAYIESETTTIKDVTGIASLKTKRDYKYDQNSNLLEVQEYDWIAANASNYVLKRKTVNSYYNQGLAMESTTTNSNFYGNPASPTFLNLAKSSEVQNGSNLAASRSENKYDGGLVNPIKGNLTETLAWDSVKQATLGNPDGNGLKLNISNSIKSTIAYDIYGNPTLMTDAMGVQSQITYDPINGVGGLYPTKMESAVNYAALKRTSTAVYDFNTGLVTSATDVDNNVTSETDYDALGRPIKVRAAVGTTSEIWTATEYDDVNRRVIARSDLATKGDGKKISIQHFDELGRVRLSRVIENIITENPYNEADGIKVQSRYRYDDGANPASSNGVYSLTSNPYRAATAAAATNEASMGWTVSYSPKNGRYSTAQTFAGAALPAPFGSNANSTGIVRTDIDANRTLVTDQAGKKRISKTNALGQLTDVWEVKTADSATESISFPNDPTVTNAYRTSYAYDTLNNLTTVNQGQQTRTFTYSSLSRLKSATNPEMGTTSTNGTINYTYDNNGNLTGKTDARNITTTYVYDNINRVTQRSYSDGITPTVSYTYDDSSVPYSKGQLTKVSSAVSETKYTAFDIMGRLLQSQQITGGTAYNPMTYTYNLSGAMIEQTYPSGRKVKNVLDNDGQLALVQSKKNQTAGYINYANSFTYTAAGAVGSMQLGNGKWESTTFNSRLQPTQIALGTVQNGTDKLKLNFNYGTTNNNGNVLSQTITTPNTTTATGFQAIQTYTYDELNRLQSATENIDGSSTAAWKQTYTFDRYGNRRFDTTNDTNGIKQTTTLDANCAMTVCNPTIDPATNKLVGYTFDTAGNTKVDANGRTFTYDAENKQTKVVSGSTIIGEYFYDGDGKRVKTKVNGEETTFIYNASGQLVAEYTNQTPPQMPKVSYLTSDHLGSPRITTDMDGKVYTRRDFMPFGEEIDANDTPKRTATLNYATDEIRQKFTGYERDDETDLDYAKARMHSYNLGRFTSPDPLLSSGRPTSPQSWNRFAYVLNNPLNSIDPNGLYECDANQDQCKAFATALAEGYEALSKYNPKSKKHKRLRRALDTYGCDASKCGEKGKNGITVGVKMVDPDNPNVGGGTYVEGVTRAITDANPTGRSIRINFTERIISDKEGLLAGTVAHEGSHAADGTDWVESNFSNRKNPSSYKTERDAFLVTSYVVQQSKNPEAWEYTFGEGKNIKEFSLWNSSWEKVDKERLRNIKGILKEGYKVTKKNRGEKTFEKGVTFKDFGL